MGRSLWALLAGAALVVAGCGGSGESRVEREAPSPHDPPATDGPAVTTPTSTSTPILPAGVTEPPDWLGTRALPLRPDGLGEIQPTPPDLVDRRFATTDHLPPPDTDEFAATVGPVPDDVAARSTWEPDCPVGLDELRYVTVTFWGFDGRPHTGELLVRADAVDVMVAGFEALHHARFPIEEMRITRRDELDAAPTGDGNNTGAFVCRPVAGGSQSWSQHAYGRAVDINPFHNPYHRGDIVIPELASAYLDRSNLRPGMLTETDVATFTDAGWGWGGHWTSLKDYQHLSATGR